MKARLHASFSMHVSAFLAIHPALATVGNLHVTEL